MNIKQNFEAITTKIEEAAKKAGVSPSSIKLLAVTKTHPVSVLDEAIAAGLTCIAENKVQELTTKIPQLTNKPEEIHFIGHLQSNKINKLLSVKPDLIHSIDKISTLKKLNTKLEEMGLNQDILIQVNTSNEDSKSGINPNEFMDFIEQAKQFKCIKIKGLMTIGALTTDEEKIRNCFKLLKQLQLKAIEKYTDIDFGILSMGMSHDFEIAIEEGANMLRVGSLLFGNRFYA